jgi:ribosomal-protein-alanine N-acetyltransferase
MRPGDVPAVKAVEDVSFPNPWPASTFLGEIQNAPISHPCVAVRGEGAGERLVGYVVFWVIEGEVQINNIAVRPEYRGKGLGEALLRRTLDLARSLGGQYVVLEVRVSNQAAVGLYRKLGFAEIGRRKGYYFNPGEDALVMGLGL